jgi:hypothetical protein
LRFEGGSDSDSGGGSGSGSFDMFSGTVTSTPVNGSGNASCTDGIMNGNETAVDCGGTSGCPRCRADSSCAITTDCESPLSCVLYSWSETDTPTCQNQCNDGVKNFLETDVDCGGGRCPACPAASYCAANTDCVAPLVCLRPANRAKGQKVCIPSPSCSDGALNGNETGVDCGGNCTGCNATLPCRSNADCAQSLVCVNNDVSPYYSGHARSAGKKHCEAPPTCTDGTAETFVYVRLPMFLFVPPCPCL